MSDKRVETIHRAGASRKLAAGAFLFFLVKGLLWLIVPAAVYTWGC